MMVEKNELELVWLIGLIGLLFFIDANVFLDPSKGIGDLFSLMGIVLMGFIPFYFVRRNY